MDKFWKWMYKKGYGNKNKYTKEYYLINFSTIAPTKQMLIGYMLEYIQEETLDIVHVWRLNDITMKDTYKLLETVIITASKSEEK